MARYAVGTPPAPFRPMLFSVREVRRRSTRTRAAADRPAAQRPCWDLHWRIDRVACSRRFERAGDAAAYRQDLLLGYASGLRYSHLARRFVPPDVPTEAPISVAAWASTYWAWKWPTLQPKGRSELARYLNRASAHFIDIDPDCADGDAIRAYLQVALRSDRTDITLTATQAAGRQLLDGRSLPLASIGRSEVEAFIERCRAHYRHPGRTVSAGTIQRMAADLRQCWDRSLIEGHLTTNPWDAVRLRDRPASATGPVKAADADLVLSPEQIFGLAQACVDHGTWGEMPRCLVLVMGFCGLRPSEAVGLFVGDLDLANPADAWLTVRRSHRKVPSRFLAPTEDHEWGPLKAKPDRASRRVPVPRPIVGILAGHLASLCEPRPFDLVFSRNGKPIDPTMFGRFVWNPARAALFPPYPELPVDSPLQPKLTRLRRHDLRHAACSLWLRAGTDIKVCQRWSGHSRLSVFLDIYQGLIPGHKQNAAARINASLAELATHPPTEQALEGPGVQDLPPAPP